MSTASQASPISVLDVSSAEYSISAEPRREFSLAAATRNAAAPTQRSIALDSATPTGLVLGTGAAASLWNFIACIHAQQRDRAFEHFDADLRHIDHLPRPHAVSTVPLPGSAWMLLMGLMGVIGSRVIPRVDGRAAQGSVGSLAQRRRPFSFAWPFVGTGRPSDMRAGTAGLGMRVQAG